MTEAVSFKEQFKRPDLVLMEGGDRASKHKKEL